ncbi:MAG: porin [Acidobacteriota bacterium]
MIRGVENFRSSARFVAVATAFALALVTAPAASADWTTKWSNGFKVESKDKAFKLKFGGRIMADYTFVDADDLLEPITDGDGFEFRRARLFFSGTIYDRVTFKANYDFTGGEADFKDVYIGLKQDWGEIRFGHYKEYFSLEELTSSKYLAFLERSLNNAFSPSRGSGIGVHGSKGDKMNWGFGAFYDADDFGISLDEDNVNITGRVAFRPIYEDKGRKMLHIGIAATQKDRASRIRFRVRPEAHFTGRFVDTGNFSADDALLFGLEIAGVHNNFWYAAEYNQADVSTPGAGDPTFDGGYVQFGYFFGDDYKRFKTSGGVFDRQKPSENWGKDGGRGAWEVAFRYSTIDLDDGAISGGQEDNWTIGVNWYPNPATRLMINLVHADVDNVGEADFFLVRWQVDF